MLSIRDYSLVTVLFLSEFSRGAFLLTFLPIYTTESLGWEITSAGVAVSVHYLTETLVKSFVGWRLDHSGKPIFMGGLFLGLVSLILIWLFPHPGLLIMASALLGLGYAPIWIGVITQVAPSGIKNRASRIGLVFIAWLTGIGSGLTVINFFIPYGYHLAFFVIIMGLFAALTLSGIFYPRVRPSAFRPVSSHTSMISAIKSLAVNKTTTQLLLPGMFLQTLSASLLLPVLPVFAKYQLGLSHKQYGLLIIA